MAFDLATAKTRLGITGTAQDALITSACNAALAAAENYCDRRFLYKRDSVSFYDARSRKLSLDRYPIVSINTISAKGSGSVLDTSTYHVHNWSGMILFHGAPFFDELDIDYNGGYQTLPADLELALWMIFDGVWPIYSSNGGGGAATAGGAPGAITSISVPDVGTLRFDNSASNGGGSGANGAFGLIPVGAVNFLYAYRRERC
jgi:hypothetical protein